MSINLGHKSPININTNGQLKTPDKGNVQCDGLIADSFVGRLKLLNQKEDEFFKSNRTSFGAHFHN